MVNNFPSSHLDQDGRIAFIGDDENPSLGIQSHRGPRIPQLRRGLFLVRSAGTLSDLQAIGVTISVYLFSCFNQNSSARSWL